MFKSNPSVIESDLCEVSGPSPVMDVLRGKKGLSTSISESLGALVIGVLVLAGIGVGIGAAYNYSQDSNAKASLDAVASAEVLYQAKNGRFGIVTELTGGEDPALSAAATNVKITLPPIVAPATVTTGINYCAVVKSGSMFAKTYWITSTSGKILETLPTTLATGLPNGMTSCPTAP